MTHSFLLESNWRTWTLRVFSHRCPLRTSRERAKPFHSEISTFFMSKTSLTSIILWHPENCLTYVAPALWFQVFPVILDDVIWLFWRGKKIQASSCSKWHYRCSDWGSGCRRRTWTFWRDCCIVRRPGATRSSHPKRESVLNSLPRLRRSMEVVLFVLRYLILLSSVHLLDFFSKVLRSLQAINISLAADFLVFGS